jgi:uncharacterized membrane protein YjgN (DUF898 family)
MESNLSENKNYKLEFKGVGADFFGIIIVNWLLTALTLGLYYPWAKAKKLQYLYNVTKLNDSPFQFHGTGKEMFKGFIKAVLIFLVFYAVLILFFYLKMPGIGLILFYLLFFAILPFAIHGSYRYRMSRSSWRGIRFGYRGDRNELIVNFFKWIGLTIISFGLYGSWFVINMRSFIIGNIKFGDIQMKYKGEGSDYFLINIKGYFLTLLTLGIYMFWWQKELLDYYINNVSLHKGNEKIKLKSTVEGSGLLVLTLVNVLMLIFSLGLAYAWVEMRTLNYFISNIKMYGNIDLDTIKQTEEIYKDATGEDIEDILDMDFVM